MPKLLEGVPALLAQQAPGRFLRRDPGNLVQDLPHSPEEWEAYRAMLARQAEVDRYAVLREGHRQGGLPDNTDAGTQQSLVAPGTYGTPGDVIDYKGRIKDHLAEVKESYLRRQEQLDKVLQTFHQPKGLTRAEVAELEAAQARMPKRLDLGDIAEEDRLKAIARRRAEMGKI